MSKKRSKSGSKSVAAAPAVKSWDAALCGAHFDEDGWQASVAMVVCGRVEDEAHIPAMLQAIRVPLRRLFTAITWDDVMTQINELGNPKGKRPKDLPVFYEILEVAKTAVDAGQAISLPVLAKLIKFMLLGVKQKDQQWRAAEKKAAEDKAKEMAEVDCGKEPVKSPVKNRGKSAKGNKGKKLPEPPQIKKDTKLTRRGEQEEVKSFIDDEPDDGPQHYVFLMGFLQPQLLPMLKELGVTVSAVICVSSQTYAEDKPEELLAGRVEELQAFWRCLSPVLEGVGHGYSLDTVARLKYTVHDSLLPEDPADQNTMAEFGAALFEDMACLMYDLLDWRQHYRHYLNSMELLQIPTVGQSLVQNGMSANSKRKGQSSETTGLPPPVIEDPSAVDMRFYRDLLDPIPPECVSVPLMIHCILEQVVAAEEGRPPPSQLRDPPRADGLNPDLAKSLSAAVNRFPLSPDDNESLAALFGTSLRSLGQEHIKPKILSFNDEITSRTHHLQAADGLDVAQIEKDMLRRLPVCGILLDPGLHKVDNASRVRAQELLQYCSGAHGCAGQVEQASTQHAVRQFVFENLELSSVDEAGELTVVHQADNVSLAWDNPLDFAKNVQRQNRVKDVHGSSSDGNADVSASHVDDQETHKEDDLNVEIEKLQETQLRCLDDWNYTERYEPDVLIQALVEASERYICVDTYRLHLDGSLLLFFHNPMSEELQSLEYWDIALHTNVSFRDYLEHVAELLTDWLRGQENTMGPIAPKANAMSLPVPATPTAKSKPGSGRKKSKERSPPRSRKGSAAVKGDKAEEPPPLPKYSSSFVREGSLKAWKEERERARQDAEETERVRTAKKGGGKRDKSPGKARKDDKSPGGRRSSARSKSAASSPPRSASKRSPRQKEEAKKEAAPPAETPRTPPAGTPRPGTPPAAPRQRYPLLGYDMDGKLVQVYGKTISLYPSDGGIIRVETTQFIRGCTSVRVCVQKDGHRFLVHRLNAVLVADGHEEACRVTPEVVTGGPCNGKHQNLEKKGFPHGCEGSFGSFTATFSDRITLSFSSHGPGGKSQATKEDPGLIAALSIPSAMAPTPLPSANPTSPPAGVDKRSKSPKSPKSPKSARAGRKRTASSPAPPQPCETPAVVDKKPPEQAKQEPPQVERVEEKLSSPSTLALSMSCPNGLSMHIYTDTSIGVIRETGARLLVRFSGVLGAGPAQGVPYELSRVVTSDGAVVRSISDGSTQVLFADGSVSFSPDSGPVVPPPVAKPEKLEHPDQTPTPDIVPKDSGNKRVGRSLTKSTAKRGNSQQDVHEPPPPLESVEQPKTGTWFTTTPLGHTIGTCGGERLDVKPVRFYKATDPQTGAVMITREDKVVTVTDVDGRIVADHVDGTRITTYHRHILDHNSDEQETGEGVVRTVRRVKCVTVESVGLPTLQWRPDDGSCTALFGSGTVLHAKPDGTYQLCPSGGEGSLFIASDGEARYSPGRVSSPALDSLPGTRDPALTPGTYFLRHVAPLACEAVDVYGNHFQVLCNGEASTSLAAAAAAGAGAEDERGDGEEAQGPAGYDTHAPRLFAIHADGSGTEFIRREDAERFLSWADGHPTTTVIRESLPDHPAVQGVTVLSPVEKDVRQRWLLLQKQESDITPQSLRSRQWRTFPAREEKKAGPRFGTCIGRGLTIDHPCELNVKPAVSPCVEKRPDVLRARQLLCYPAVTTEMRCKLQLRLKEYLEQLLQREKQREEMKIQDPRLADEKTHISHLLKLVLSMPEDSPRYYHEDERRAELADLYEQSFTTQPPSSPPDAQAEQEETGLQPNREEASQRTQALWAEKIAKERQEVEKAREDIQALRHRIITPYFSSELGRTFLLSQAMDLEALSKEVPHTPRKPSPALDCTSEDGDERQTDDDSPITSLGGSTGPQAAGQVEFARLYPVHQPVRSPRTATQLHTDGPVTEVPAAAERHPRDFTRHHAKSLALDVTGSVRRERVRLPAAVLASRPRSVPNEKVGALARSELLQGFTLLPTRVNFGSLRQGSSNVRRIRLQNVGTEQRRFKVKAPPSSTGMRVIYTPGPVAAGIHIELILELRAENLGPVSYEVQIQTEAETLLVPVTATVLSDVEYEEACNSKIRATAHTKSAPTLNKDNAVLTPATQSIQMPSV
ncbi:sperm-associated antigen 17 isoform X4 [Lethenteron reissneri]|uniref:sperm-associated antigen 17 isoform X4 n=1 Tax=Lethenteron reissneri TaxID=7753 RepID=UPI002AB75FFE|nr:sperm-associated antigen 17 isoform X4 [Lethenteron reissneri]